MWDGIVSDVPRVGNESASDATVVADNLPWADYYANKEKMLGYYDLPAMTTAADATNSTMSRTFDMTTIRFRSEEHTSELQSQR